MSVKCGAVCRNKYSCAKVTSSQQKCIFVQLLRRTTSARNFEICDFMGNNIFTKTKLKNTVQVTFTLSSCNFMRTDVL